MKNFKVIQELRFVTLGIQVRSAYLNKPDCKAMDCPPSENCGNCGGRWASEPSYLSIF